MYMPLNKKHIFLFIFCIIFIGSVVFFTRPAWGQTIIDTVEYTLRMKERPISMITYENEEFGFRFEYPEKFINEGKYIFLKHKEHRHKDNSGKLFEVNFINPKEASTYLPLQLFFHFEAKNEDYVNINSYLQKEIESIRNGPYGNEEKIELLHFDSLLTAGFTAISGRYTGVRKYIDHDDYVYEVGFSYESGVFDPEFSMDEYKKRYGDEMGKYYSYQQERYDVIQRIINSFIFLYDEKR